MRRISLACLLIAGLAGCPDDTEVAGDTQTSDTQDLDTTTVDTMDSDSNAEDAVEDTALDTTGPDGEDAAVTGWQVPTCETVTGNSGVTFTTDEVTFAPPATVMGTGRFADGLVVTDVPGTLYLSQDSTLYRSTDSGCEWSELDAPSAEYRLTPSVAGVVYAYWLDNDLLQIEGTTVTPIDVNIKIAALGVDRDDPAVLLAATPTAGVIYRSTNGGVTFAKVGDGFDHFTNAYRYVFDPNDVNHIVLGVTVTASWVTFDGGETWTQSTGFAPAGQVNAFDQVISPVDGDIVWANGLSIDQNSAGHPSDGRHIYRSTDGGLTFEPVVDHTSERPFNTNMPMTAHPTDPDVVYIVRNGWSDADAEIYRYNAGNDRLKTITPGFSMITRFAWAPTDPPTMYLGVGTH